MTKWGLRFAYLGGVALGLLLFASKFHPETGFTALLGLGERWEVPRAQALADDGLVYHVHPDSGGYDGQFYALIALDPSLQDADLAEAIDAPAYRARRILLPALAFVLGAGEPAWVLTAYALLNVGFWLLLAALLLHWLPPVSWENWTRWALILFSMGVLESVRLALTDLPSLVFMLGGLWLYEKNRLSTAAWTLPLVVFTKETGVIHALSYFSAGRAKGRWRWRWPWQIIVALGTTVAAFGCWLIYLAQLFPTNLNAGGNLTLPFLGLAQAVAEAFQGLAADGFDDRFFFRLIAALGLLFQLGYLVLRPQMGNALWRMGLIFGLLFLCLGEFVWWGYWAVSRVALPLTVAFCLLYRPQQNWTLYAGLLGSNLVMVHGLIRWL